METTQAGYQSDTTQLVEYVAKCDADLVMCDGNLIFAAKKSEYLTQKTTE